MRLELKSNVRSSAVAEGPRDIRVVFENVVILSSE